MRVFGRRHTESDAFSLGTFRELPVAVCLTLVIALGWSVTRLAMTGKASITPRARLSQTISVHAGGRGNPSIHLNDGREVLTSYSGPPVLTHALQQNLAQPLALASSDFDEDGVPDLICGYAHSSSGIITWLRGNVDSIYENSPEAQRRKATGEFSDAPFLSPARVFGLPIKPDFLGAGDFDADDHWDIVAAARGSDKLYLLSGDGQGGFAPGKTLDLPGRVTALVTGDINRRDGLDDVIVAVNGQDGPKLIVFEGSEGALKAKPEIFDLPAEATGLALGQLDDDYPIDIAVAAGRELLVVHGRDRSEAVAELRREPACPATISRRSFDFAIRSLAVGDFIGGGDYASNIALLSEDGALHLLARESAAAHAEVSAQEGAQWEEVGAASSTVSTGGIWLSGLMITARVSSLPTDALLVLDPPAHQIRIATSDCFQAGLASPSRREAISLDVEAEPIAALPMRLNQDALSDLVILSSGNNAPTVVKTAAAATFIVTNKDDIGPGSLRQAIIDANDNAGADTIVFKIPPETAPFTITPASRVLPLITEAVTIDGCSQQGFQGTPVVELDGDELRGSPQGLIIKGSNSVVRGIVIHSFKEAGIQLSGTAQSPAGYNVIEGNFIGTNRTGTMTFDTKRAKNGISTEPFGPVLGSNNNLIGGTHCNGRNLISGNVNGIKILGEGSTSNRVQGNYIGTDIGGSEPLRNIGNGVWVFDRPNNTIGGMKPGARNLISGNGDPEDTLTSLNCCSPGLAITEKGATGNVVQGNYIGTNFDGTKITNLDGTKTMGNASEGVLINLGAAANTIGGATARARNVISGNLHNGVVIGSEGSAPKSDNIVQGNFIGTDSSGTVAKPNVNDGVIISKAGNPSMIKNNVISANGRNGVSIGGFYLGLFGGSRSVVEDNKIGTDANGVQNLGNMCHGIYVENNSLTHTIKNNIIAFNGKIGVVIPKDPDPEVRNAAEGKVKLTPGVGIMISQNSIFSNVDIGIDLGEPGVTENNHPRDPNKPEANEGQNFPELSNVTNDVTNDGENITVQVKLEKSTPNTPFTIEFFSNTSRSSSGCVRQGQHFIKTVPITTDANGAKIINVVLPKAMADAFINATATDPAGNTSEFSDCARLGPRLIKITVTSNLVAVGSGFIEPVEVFINDFGFSELARVKSGGTRVIQNGKLTNGHSIAEEIPPGKVVKIKFRNRDGAETEVSFRN